MRVVGRRGDRQHTADRLDPVDGAVLVDEGDHGLDRRSSSAMRKIGRRLAQDLVGLAQLTVLALQRLDPLAFVRGRPGPQALVALGLPDPVAQRLARAADLGRDRLDGRLLRAVLALMVQNHPHRAVADFRRIGGCTLRHGSILSRVGASRKPGAVQNLGGDHGGAPLVAVVDHLHQIAPLRGGQLRHGEVVQDEHADLGELAQEAVGPTLKPRHCEIVEQAIEPGIEDRVTLARGLVAERAHDPGFADPGRADDQDGAVLSPSLTQGTAA